MTAYYVEPGAYPAYAATPANTTTAYDGDGLAKGVATPAVTTIDCTSLTASATNTLIVCGATLTCVASGAGTNQFNAASGSTLASNLASAINAATNAVIAPQTGWVTPQLRNACYASASGATLTIQTRCGSAKYNTATSATWVVTGTGGLSTVNASFTGGVSGAWGYLINDANDGAMWPSSVAVNTYGVWQTGTTATGPHAPIAGPSNSINSETDIVNVKGTGKEINPSTAAKNSTTTVLLYRSGTYLFDDGTEWSGATGGITFRCRTTASYSDVYSSQANVTFRIVGRSLGCVKFWTQNYSTHLGSIYLTTTSSTVNGTFVLDTVYFDDDINQIYVTGNGTGANAVLHVTRCKWDVSRNAFYRPLRPTSQTYAGNTAILEDCILDFGSYNGATTSLFDIGSGVNTTNVYIVRNCEVITAGSTITAVSGAVLYGSAIFENLAGVSLTDNLGMVGGVTTPASCEAYSQLVQQQLGDRYQYKLETASFTLDYTPGADYPYSNAYLPDGTGWSYKWQWSNLANAIRPYGIEVVRRSQFVTQTGLNTVGLELLFPSTSTPTLSDMGIVVSYIRDSDSAAETVHSFTSFAKITDATAIPTSAASWTKPGAYSTYVARKLEVTLPDDIKQNTIVDVGLRFFKAASSATSVFINPEVAIS